MKMIRARAGFHVKRIVPPQIKRTRRKSSATETDSVLVKNKAVFPDQRYNI